MRNLVAALLCALTAGTAAAEPTAEQILSRYDEIMAPGAFDADAQMTSTREDGSSRTYGMRMLRGSSDKFRIWFREPASVKGQEMLRVGDNMWIYLPNVKRATRIASRESFQGGDFNNADVLRVNYASDYAGKIVPTGVPGTVLLELKAKTPDTAYDSIKLWVRKPDLQPVKGEYYGSSGQLIRSAQFSEYTDFAKGYLRPARVVMQNELVKARRSELLIRSMKLNAEAPPQRFTQADLGR